MFISYYYILDNILQHLFYNFVFYVSSNIILELKFVSFLIFHHKWIDYDRIRPIDYTYIWIANHI